ncbi:ankyrin repeat-containing protein [Chrysochromulina tobinii]|uniref:Ankyrin repeat-containing protein n=1 Tax=Chrysochromulina tobinii TaxID=1460289 RepID=A0A0M0JAE2_9EUKA|nr:ankyrin repeat-containing protein [Chrysochromulina tobinii]|eukprot:KOO23559.1 ankyrin repeat-containing protein [Chrysochromulina sp. CCMP291]
MQAVRDAFPLAMVSETFPHDVDQRIDKILLESCTTRWSVGYAQFWYGSNQFREGYDKDLELVANSIGITALMLAAMEGNVDAARILLRRGASVGLVNCYGRTAIILAAMAGHVEMVKLLLSVDAPIDISDAFGRDALAWAEARGHKHVAILVRKHAHERRDWRMEMLREREAHRAAIAGKMSSGSPSSAGGAIDGARYQPGADAAVDASYDASARSATSSARRETACSSTSFAGPSYAVPTSSHEAVGSARHNRAPFRRIGPIGFGVLSSRKGALPAAVAQKHGLAPVAGAPAAAPVLSPTKASAKSSTTTSTASSVSSASGISSAVSGISSAVSGSFASSSATSVVSGTPPATGLRPGAKSSVRGSARTDFSSARSAVLSTRSMPGFISKFSLGSADGRLGARAGSSTNPNLDLFLATQKAREAGAHGGATSDRGPSNAWEPLPMETLPDSMAARRHHDREWEERLRMKHELRSVDSKKFHSSRRRHWMSSSRRWIERRKEVKASMTPKDRKASRLRLYSSPRHYTTQPRVYT